MFEPATTERRRAAIRAMMRARGYDALIIYGLGRDQNDNVEYVVGPCSANALALFPLDGDPVAWVQPAALAPFVARTAHCETRSGGFNYHRELIGELRARALGAATIGIVEVNSLRTLGIPHTLYLALTEAFPAARWPLATEDFERARLMLLPEEFAVEERAARELDEVIDVFVDAVRPGITAAGAADIAKVYAKERGFNLTALSTRAAPMGPEGNVTDPANATRALQPGDYVFFESNVAYGPFRAYRGFPICLGEPPEPARTLFETTLEVANAVAAAFRPGGRSSDIIAIGDIVPQRGLWCHGPLASGLTTGGWQMLCVRGFDAYRPPTELTFEPGMVFTAFPHLMTPDNRKVTIIGNMVRVTEDGPQILGSQGMRYVVK